MSTPLFLDEDEGDEEEIGWLAAMAARWADWVMGRGQTEVCVTGGG